MLSQKPQGGQNGEGDNASQAEVKGEILPRGGYVEEKEHQGIFQQKHYEEPTFSTPMGLSGHDEGVLQSHSLSWGYLSP